MTSPHESPTELETLLEALCEDRITADQALRLEQLVLASDEARWKYLTYIDLHGTLYWDAAGVGAPEPLSSDELPTDLLPAKSLAVSPIKRPTKSPAISRFASVMSACLAVVIVGAWQLARLSSLSLVIAPNPKVIETIGFVGPNRVHRTEPRTYGPPISLQESNELQISPIETISSEASDHRTEPNPIQPLSTAEIVAKIDQGIQSRWLECGISPSEMADDSEWLRRVYLDLVGRVPTVPEAESFLANSRANSRESKREQLVEKLLDDVAYVRNFTTKWTNLLIGRISNPQVDRYAFQKFLRMSFAANRPWNQIVADLISAEGTNTENGATNFLIAHLNNDATPATAVVSKMFLGRQVQCNQCHNNPFDETQQIAFWEMNSFFQQTTAVARQRRDPKTGRLAYVSTELVTRDAGGPTYFETQSGLMRVAYPRFNGRQINPSADINRRRELAQLMTYGDQPQLAQAFVNRMWEHFFGSGFTRSVDDMGTHRPVSHPELLTLLSEQFIQSGYDVKQLVRWICQSEAYQLSSRFSDSNHDDDPSISELPAFSRMYVRSMTAEQTYDSFLTATKAHQVGAVDWIQAENHRQQWLRQFVIAFNTDENDETMTFEGSVGNALSLMNGPLIKKALDVSVGSFLGEVVRQKSSDSEKIRQLSLAALSRPPSPHEMASFKKLVKANGRGTSKEAYQDLFWALLNSNEFAVLR